MSTINTTLDGPAPYAKIDTGRAATDTSKNHLAYDTSFLGRCPNCNVQQQKQQLNTLLPGEIRCSKCKYILLTLDATASQNESTYDYPQYRPANNMLDFSATFTRVNTADSTRIGAERQGGSISSGRDSGYSSKVPSLVAQPSEDWDKDKENSQIQEKPTTKRVVKLRQFDKPVPTEARERFADLARILLEPLRKYLSKTKRSFRGISIDLKTLGETEATARLWIVVFCDQEISKRVKKFFNRPENKLEYQPRDTTLFPRFELLVSSYPPLIKASLATDVFGAEADGSSPSQTLCGSRIFVPAEEGMRMATVGGMIMATGGLSDVHKMFGMTVGHVLPEQLPDTADGSVTDCDNESEVASEASYESSEEDRDDSLGPEQEVYELDDGDITLPTCVIERDTRGIRNQAAERAGFSTSASTKLGHISRPFEMLHLFDSYCDWGLVSYDHPCHDLLPNTMVDDNTCSDNPRSENVIDLKMAAGALSIHEPDRSVRLLGPNHTVKAGTLSAGTAYLMEGQRQSFAAAYKLVLRDGQQLEDGECGSWIVDTETHCVWGHVVAANALGEIYVMALDQSLRQIALHLNATSVRLPTRCEVEEFRKSHCSCEKHAIDDKVESMASPKEDHDVRGRMDFPSRTGNDETLPGPSISGGPRDKAKLRGYCLRGSYHGMTWGTKLSFHRPLPPAKAAASKHNIYGKHPSKGSGYKSASLPLGQS